ncbi:MAG TPA: STAS domain-containing protein [Acidobacteriaceae bacterium]|jgi:anti-anti-sigma factor|nr:STAS domain-containing protein [Acidobacteriaceae bacterium]
MSDTAAAPAPPTPTLSIDVEPCPSPSEVTIRCHGRLVAGVTDVLVLPVRALIPKSKRIVLDLSDLKHTDSSGLGALVRLYVSAKSAGCSLELMHLSKQVRHLLGLTNMFDVFVVIGENRVKFM